MMIASPDFDSAFAAHQRTFAQVEALKPLVERASEICAQSVRSGGKVMFCGNGGSAGDAQHLAAELVGRLVRNRSPLPGLALNTDSSAVTCIANDFGYDDIFVRQVLGLGRKGDTLIAISTSGQSPNVIKAVDAAREIGVTTIGFLGKGGGPLAGKVDLSIVVPSDETARVQEAHIFIGHVMCALLERHLGVGGWD